MECQHGSRALTAERNSEEFVLVTTHRITTTTTTTKYLSQPFKTSTLQSYHTTLHFHLNIHTTPASAIPKSSVHFTIPSYKSPSHLYLLKIYHVLHILHPTPLPTPPHKPSDNNSPVLPTCHSSNNPNFLSPPFKPTLRNTNPPFFPTCHS